MTWREVGSRPPKLLLLNDCSDQVNYGAEALMEGLFRIFTAAIPDHTLRLIPSHLVIDPEPDWFKAFHNGRSLVQPSAIWPEVADQFDAVIHIDDTRAVEPLERTSVWETGEMPETYPFAV